jgi:MoaA/NifB/PqqE/SkfB family radical SAM enzyme
MVEASSVTGQKYISLETFELHLEFLERSKINQVRLIGGEPTLHPKFSKLIDRAEQTGKHIVVFTNGIMPGSALQRLSHLPLDACTILVNTSASRPDGKLSKEESEKQRRTIFELGSRVVLGFNISRLKFDLEPLIQLIEDANCRKEIRLGLAQPQSTGQNCYLHPKQYPAAGRKIVGAARLASDLGIFFSFDCGFVRCMFSEEDLNFLRSVNTDIGWRCNPILDITLDGKAIHCYPLGEGCQLQVTEEVNAAELRQELAKKFAYLRPAGIYPECSTCAYKESGECTGGCLGGVTRRLRRSSVQITVPDREVLEA